MPSPRNIEAGLHRVKGEVSGDVKRDREDGGLQAARASLRVRADQQVWQRAGSVDARRLLAAPFVAIDDRRKGSPATCRTRAGAECRCPGRKLRAKGSTRAVSEPLSQWVVKLSISKMVVGPVLSSSRGARQSGVDVLSERGWRTSCDERGPAVAREASERLVAQGCLEVSSSERSCDPPIMLVRRRAEVSDHPIMASSGLARFQPGRAGDLK